MMPKAFDSLEAWLHQDAVVTEGLRNWARSLNTWQAKELKNFIEKKLADDLAEPSFSYLIRYYSHGWKIPERKLKSIFREIVLEELLSHA